MAHKKAAKKTKAKPKAKVKAKSADGPSIHESTDSLPSSSASPVLESVPLSPTQPVEERIVKEKTEDFVTRLQEILKQQAVQKERFTEIYGVLKEQEKHIQKRQVRVDRLNAEINEEFRMELILTDIIEYRMQLDARAGRANKALHERSAMRREYKPEKAKASVQQPWSHDLEQRCQRTRGRAAGHLYAGILDAFQHYQWDPKQPPMTPLAFQIQLQHLKTHLRIYIHRVLQLREYRQLIRDFRIRIQKRVDFQIASADYFERAVESVIPKSEWSFDEKSDVLPFDGPLKIATLNALIKAYTSTIKMRFQEFVVLNFHSCELIDTYVSAGRPLQKLPRESRRTPIAILKMAKGAAVRTDEYRADIKARLNKAFGGDFVEFVDVSRTGHIRVSLIENHGITWSKSTWLTAVPKSISVEFKDEAKQLDARIYVDR